MEEPRSGPLLCPEHIPLQRLEPGYSPRMEWFSWNKKHFTSIPNPQHRVMRHARCHLFNFSVILPNQPTFNSPAPVLGTSNSGENRTG